MMARYFLAALALVAATPAAAQITATLPVTCNASGTNCIRATPVVNPDGTTISGGGGGGSTPTAASGASSATAVPVQSVNGAALATAANQPARDSNGDLRVPTVTATPFYVSISANTSTEILAASATRVAYDIQCAGTAPVGLSRVHATLTSATPSAGGVDIVIPAGTTPYFMPPYSSGLGVTAYTGTAQACWGVSYARQ